jgi:hypothetical protein
MLLLPTALPPRRLCRCRHRRSQGTLATSRSRSRFNRNTLAIPTRSRTPAEDQPIVNHSNRNRTSPTSTRTRHSEPRPSPHLLPLEPPRTSNSNREEARSSPYRRRRVTRGTMSTRTRRPSWSGTSTRGNSSSRGQSVQQSFALMSRIFPARTRLGSGDNPSGDDRTLTRLCNNLCDRKTPLRRLDVSPPPFRLPSPDLLRSLFLLKLTLLTLHRPSEKLGRLASPA